MFKLKWQKSTYYDNESHNAYVEDIENKRKMLSLIIKKVWYIPIKKKMQQKTNKNSKISSYPKLSSWRLMGQQFGRAERQQYLGLSP